MRQLTESQLKNMSRAELSDYYNLVKQCKEFAEANDLLVETDVLHDFLQRTIAQRQDVRACI